MLSDVDPVCINQTDIPERNSQVLIMRDIYRGASETLVWLGEADLDHGAAFNLLEDFCATQKDKIYQCVSEFKRDQDRFSWYPKGEDVSHMVVSADSVTDCLWVAEHIFFTRGHNIIPSLNSVLQWLNGKGRDSSQSIAWIKIEDILLRPWWRRCWIVQEVAVSAHILLYCGSRFVAWYDLVLFLRCVYLARVHTRRAGRDVDPMISKALESGYSVSVLSLIREQEKKAHCTLHNLLRSTVKFLASDRRDKVYALFGLLDKRVAAYGITTEYGPSATVRDVFIAATKAIMLVDHVWPFRLLGSVEARTDMPSWVPPFTSDCNSGLIQQPYSPRAGGLGLPKSELLNNDRVLRVTGIEVAYIDDGICPQYVGGRICQTLKAWTTFALQRLSEAGSLTPQAFKTF